MVVIRFGGGVRRAETIEPATSYSPFLVHELLPRGVFYKDMRISPQEGVVTSHAHGTLYILTGRYDRYQDIEARLFSERFEPKAPTIFEYLRKAFAVAPHETLIVNGEDRANEDFLTFSEHHLYGVRYRSTTLSLYWFKLHLLRRQLEEGKLTEEEVEAARSKLAELEARNYRGTESARQPRQVEAFWDKWRAYYGDSGLVNPRGDRLLTELAVRAMQQLRPRLLMVNYQDPDYVHWGNLSHYTRAISIIDDGIRQIVATAAADPFYRDNTVFVVVPDCGRDNNPLLQVSCQHHFNSRSAHEIWALVFGAGIPRGKVVDRPVDQISIAATIGRTMGLATNVTEGPVLEEVFG